MTPKEFLQRYWVVTPVPTLTYSRIFNEFNNNSWNFGVQAPILFSVLGSFFGSNTVIYGAILLDIIGLIWIRQEDAAVPLMLLFTLSNILLFTPGMVPIEWQWIIGSFEALVMGGIAYTLFRGRRLS
jgi:hypothetical protein